MVRAEQATGVQDDQLDDYLFNAVHDEGLNGRTEDAVHDLVYPRSGIEPADSDAARRYQEGQHRVAAQLDQGVRRTVIQRTEVISLSSGQPRD
jgi:hypothetical protein